MREYFLLFEAALARVEINEIVFIPRRLQRVHFYSVSSTPLCTNCSWTIITTHATACLVYDLYASHCSPRDGNSAWVKTIPLLFRRSFAYDINKEWIQPSTSVHVSTKAVTRRVLDWACYSRLFKVSRLAGGGRRGRIAIFRIQVYWKLNNIAGLFKFWLLKGVVGFNNAAAPFGL